MKVFAWKAATMEHVILKKPTQPIRRYEITWEREPSLTATVEEAWSRRDPTRDLGDISASMKAMMNSLYSWKSKHLVRLQKTLRRKGSKWQIFLCLLMTKVCVQGR
jgi:hypothetical protein